jgi:membrane protein DedA with SNARE-associated domain
MSGLAARLAHHGLGLVFANVLLQQAGVPIPAEPTLVVAGSLAAKGLMSRVGLVLVTVAAATLADVSWFLLGRRFGPAVLRLAARLSVKADDLSSRGGGTFARWGLRSLVVAKFLPGVSQVVVPMSGATGIAFRSFIFYDLLGTLVWSAVPIASGMVFHEQVDAVLSALARVGVWVLLAALAVGVAWLARRFLVRGRHGAELARPVGHPLNY